MLLSLIIILPFLVTYFHLYNVLHIQECVVVVETHEESSTAAIYCRRHQRNNNNNNNLSYRLVSVKDDFQGGVPPSIATLATLVEETTTRRRRRATTQRQSIERVQSEDNSLVLWDYANPVWTSLTERIWNVWQTAAVDATVEEATLGDSTVNKYGFRSNSSKSSVTTGQLSKSYLFLPWATYFWMAVNIALYLLYWQRKVPVTTVALNVQLLLGDLGRALTGNLAHFEIWHLGVNMMSASALGADMALERSLGSIPLFLLTLSWIPLTTIVVVGLLWTKTKWLSRDTTSSSTSTIASAMVSSFPNMVGFSGILFAWMVVATLQSQQRSCPVFFLPNLCFDVYQIGGFSVSLGPLVQLVVLQVILPRASFVGHLAGIVVGFLFHWRIQPSLEWSQPCLLFPAIWLGGKYLSLKFFDSVDARSLTNSGGGRVLGSGTTGTVTVPWRTSTAEGPSTQVDDRSAAIWILHHLRIAMILHIVLLGSTMFIRHPLNSMVVSGLLVPGLLTLFVNAGKSSGRTTKLFNQEFAVGMLGRAAVVLLLVQCITDAMTLAGWIVTSPLWRFSIVLWILVVCWLLRISSWIAALCLVCRVLSLTDELPQQESSNVWTNVLGWWLVKPCTAAGKQMTRTSWGSAEGTGDGVAGNDSGRQPLESVSSGHALRGRLVSEVV